MRELNELLYLTRCGEESAREELYEYYYHLVKVIVQKYSYLNYGLMEDDDLIQIGMLCFDNIVDEYREDGGASCKTYFSFCITRKIKNALTREKDIRIKRQYTLVSLESDIKQSGGRKYCDVIADEHSTYSPDRRLHINDEKESIENFIQQEASTVQKRIYYLRIAGYKDQEIAKIMNVPIKVVYNATHRLSKKYTNEK